MLLVEDNEFKQVGDFQSEESFLKQTQLETR